MVDFGIDGSVGGGRVLVGDGQDGTVWICADHGVALDAAGTAALIAELTRREALLAGEAGACATCDPDGGGCECGNRAPGAGPPARIAEKAPQIEAVLDTSDLEAIEGARRMLAGTEEDPVPVRTAEDERADVVAWLKWKEAASAPGSPRIGYAADFAASIAGGEHEGERERTCAQPIDWSGPGHYAGRDTAGRPVLLHAETAAGLSAPEPGDAPSAEERARWETLSREAQAYAYTTPTRGTALDLAEAFPRLLAAFTVAVARAVQAERERDEKERQLQIASSLLASERRAHAAPRDRCCSPCDGTAGTCGRCGPPIVDGCYTRRADG